ncbi:acyltransferase [Rhizobium sp. CCGE531]|uniref:acyltransferase n=1 Tax=Rhizobium sp. CCGE531 TaxID=2364271 RepID=UPI00247A4DA4|nr:acyltransferase [Rhizobium sp. CCGE531]
MVVYAKGLALETRLRIFSVKTSGRLRVEGYSPIVENYGTMVFGRKISFRAQRKLPVLVKAKKGAVLTIGDGTFLNEGVSVVASQAIDIGRNCMIGDNAAIHDSHYHAVDEGDEISIAPIRIGNNVWIGRNALIFPGVQIGDHSVIGAGSIVTRSIPSHSVAAGNPARVIKRLSASDSFVRH